MNENMEQIVSRLTDCSNSELEVLQEMIGVIQETRENYTEEE